MNIYLLSGLGADGRVFQKLALPSDYTTKVIEYVLPLPKETIQDYAKRIIETQIDILKPFCLIGVSFGGILATEMMQYCQPVQTFLVSSIGCKNELPFLYRLGGFLKLNHFIPSKKVNKPNFLTYYIFGTKTKEDKALLKSILTSSNTQFSKWAVNEIVNWKRKLPPTKIIRIHGTRDRLLPIKNFEPDYTIKNGGHLTIIQQNEAVSHIITKELNILLKEN